MTRILLADDAPFMRMQCGRMLTALGYEVIEAENGRDAVAKYSQHRPDAVLLDVTMPELDGIAALRQIKELDPDARIAMVSALGQQRVVMEALQAGARDFVMKPFVPDRILAAVANLMG